MNNKLQALVLFFLLATCSSFVAAQESETGIIAGSVVDQANGEAMIGAAIRVEEINSGAICDLDGNYRIARVPVGTYTLSCSMIGYNTMRITDVIVIPGDVVRIDFVMESEAIEVEEVVVRAQAITNTEAALLKDRQKSDAVSDAISAEAISQSGSGDAASAMKQVTGASIVDGRDVYVRGLGDRYTSVQLNGSQLPSANPDRRSSPMDLFPSNLLDNIVTVKTFTPDKPGDFSGGTVDVQTKSYPEKFFFTASVSGSFNSLATLNNDFLTYKGGNTDWLGMDDGTRAVPGELDVDETLIPTIGTVTTGTKEQQYANMSALERYTNMFKPVMGPSTRQAPFNGSLAVSSGNQVELFGRPLGFLGSLTYSRNFSFYDDGSVSRWRLAGHVDANDQLTEQYRFDDIRARDEVLWGGLFNVAYKFLPEHEIGVDFMYNQNAEDNVRWLSGRFLRDLPADATYETSVLQYTERSLGSMQLHGDHVLTNVFNTRIEWKTTFSSATQDEPDLRYFSADYTMKNGEKSYSMRPNQYSMPGRYYRSLEDSNNDFAVDVSVPFNQWEGKSGTFKFGSLLMRKERSFRERRFEYNQDISDQDIIDYGWDHLSPVDYAGDIDYWVDPSNPAYGFQDSLSLVPGWSERYRFGVYIQDKSSRASNYDGNQDVDAYYAMFDMPLVGDLRFIGGARYEKTDMHVASQDTTRKVGKMTIEDVLPSVNLVYELVENMNIRAAYGKTIARPSLREMAPYSSFEFVGDYRFSGNPDIKRTLIDNYDLRWEWFTRPGELYAMSLYGKVFHDPIERVIQNQNGVIRYENVDKALVYGVELELRKRLDALSQRLRSDGHDAEPGAFGRFLRAIPLPGYVIDTTVLPFIIADTFENLQVGGNLSFVHSEVDVSDKELAAIRAVDPNRSSTREFQGQSPYIVNMNVSYDNADEGLQTGLYYNIFGRRLTEISYGGTPYVYELPQHSLNFTFSKKLAGRWSLSGSAKNLLNARYKTVHSYKGKEYVAREYKTGVSVSLGIKYSM